MKTTPGFTPTGRATVTTAMGAPTLRVQKGHYRAVNASTCLAAALLESIAPDWYIGIAREKGEIWIEFAGTPTEAERDRAFKALEAVAAKLEGLQL